MTDLFGRNEKREAPTFANINLLGSCNADCYFCLGKDISQHLSGRMDTRVHFSQWENWHGFLSKVERFSIKKIYITGQNTDPLMYPHLVELVNGLQFGGRFQVGIRTNGILATRHGIVHAGIDAAELETGYSIHSLRNETNQKIMGTDCPDWVRVLGETDRCRVSTVITRYNVDEFSDIVGLVRKFPHVQHFQVRRVSTETRKEELTPDLQAFEALHDSIASQYERIGEFYGAPIYDIEGVKATFWRTVQTNIGSINYFTDGTISSQYFIVRGYMRANGLERELNG